MFAVQNERMTCCEKDIVDLTLTLNRRMIE